ncbi:MAG: T9SS type A sorting domain-containing protein, partial [Bacteroidota bacterium]
IVALNIVGSDEDERAPSFLVGLYDPDGDGVADPLTVNGDVAGLPVTLQTGVGGLSAQDGYPQAEARARAEATARLGTPPNDLAFLGLQGFGGVEVSGLAAESSIALWEYYFYSASAGLLVTVSPAIFGTTADIMEVPSGSTVPPPLPTPVGDAEAAARAALEVGGRVFLQQNPTAFFTLAAGDLAIEQSGLRDITEGEAPEPPEGPYWLALFFGFDINTFEERVLAVYLDYQTGAVLDTYAEGFAVSTEEPTLVPTEAVLHAAYPNPFNPGTSLSFTLAQAGPVRLAVYDALGREVAVLLDEQRSIGTHVQRWDAGALPSGPYFVQLVTSGGVQTRMLVLQK